MNTKATFLKKNRCNLIFVIFFSLDMIRTLWNTFRVPDYFTWGRTIFVCHLKDSLRASNLGVIAIWNLKKILQQRVKWTHFFSRVTVDFSDALPQTLGALEGLLVLKDEAGERSRELEFILASKLVTILRVRKPGNSKL